MATDVINFIWGELKIYLLVRLDITHIYATHF